MNKQLFTDIKTRLLTVTGMKYVSLWNNQFAHLEDQSHFAFPLPCAFVEFVDVKPMQFGNGVQIYEPLVVRIHWGLEKLNEDGAQDEALDQMDMVQNIHAKLDQFRPDRASSFFRSGEAYDYDHSNLVTGYLDYTTTYTDLQQQQPIGSIESEPPTDLVIDVTVE